MHEPTAEFSILLSCPHYVRSLDRMAGLLAKTDGIDGVHFSAEAHEKIGQGAAEKVKSVYD